MNNYFKSGHRAFTLIELTIAAALAALAGAAVVLIMGRGLAASRWAENRLHQIFVMERGLNTLSRDLRNAVMLSDPIWTGTSDSISFATAQGLTQLAVVSYQMVEDEGTKNLIRQEHSFSSQDGETQTQTLVPDIANFSLAYGAVAEGGNQKSMTWLQNWNLSDQKVHLPKVIRVRIEMRDSKNRLYSIMREIWIPTGSVGTVPSAS